MTTATAAPTIKVYSYRWVVLLAYMFISLMMQVFWICYAPITRVAAETLGVSDLQIGLLAMLFMYIYIPLALPASWLIDTWGFKKSVSLGVIMMAVFGLLRGIFTQDYTLTLIMTVGLAAAQPLFLNSGTKLAANWFRLEERATIIGIGRHLHPAGHRHRPDRHAHHAGSLGAAQHHARLRCPGCGFGAALRHLRQGPSARRRPATKSVC